MAVSAVAAAVDHAFFCIRRDLERAGFEFIKCPQVILFIEIRFASHRLIFLKFPVTIRQQLPIAERFDVRIFFLTGRAVAGKRIDIDTGCYDRVDDVRHFVNIRAGDGRHHDRADACAVDAADFLERDVEAARLSEPVVCLAHAVDRELIFLAAAFFQPPTDFIRKMKGIAQNREGDMMLFEQRKQLPEVRVQNRVAAGVSAGLSPAPQAEPQAAGFSPGLSEAPHAEPHAAVGFSVAILLHPNKFASAIMFYLHVSFLFTSLLYRWEGQKKSTHKSITQS